FAPPSAWLHWMPDLITRLACLTLVRLKRLDEALAELRLAAQFAPDQARYASVFAVALHSAGRRGVQPPRRATIRPPIRGAGGPCWRLTTSVRKGPRPSPRAAGQKPTC